MNNKKNEIKDFFDYSDEVKRDEEHIQRYNNCCPSVFQKVHCYENCSNSKQHILYCNGSDLSVLIIIYVNQRVRKCALPRSNEITCFIYCLPSLFECVDEISTRYNYGVTSTNKKGEFF